MLLELIIIIIIIAFIVSIIFIYRDFFNYKEHNDRNLNKAANYINSSVKDLNSNISNSNSIQDDKIFNNTSNISSLSSNLLSNTSNISSLSSNLLNFNNNLNRYVSFNTQPSTSGTNPNINKALYDYTFTKNAEGVITDNNMTMDVLNNMNLKKGATISTSSANPLKICNTATAPKCANLYMGVNNKLIITSDSWDNTEPNKLDVQLDKAISGTYRTP